MTDTRSPELIASLTERRERILNLRASENLSQRELGERLSEGESFVNHTITEARRAGDPRAGRLGERKVWGYEANLRAQQAREPRRTRQTIAGLGSINVPEGVEVYFVSACYDGGYEVRDPREFAAPWGIDNGINWPALAVAKALAAGSRLGVK